MGLWDKVFIALVAVAVTVLLFLGGAKTIMDGITKDCETHGMFMLYDAVYECEERK